MEEDFYENLYREHGLNGIANHIKQNHHQNKNTTSIKIKLPTYLLTYLKYTDAKHKKSYSKKIAALIIKDIKQTATPEAAIF